MNTENRLDILLGVLGQELGLTDLTFNEEGAASLRFDGTLLVNLQRRLDGILFFSDLGPICHSDVSKAFETMLRANHFWNETRGATLSVHGENLSAALTLLVSSDVEVLLPHLELFVETAATWADFVAAKAEFAELEVQAEEGGVEEEAAGSVGLMVRA